MATPHAPRGRASSAAHAEEVGSQRAEAALTPEHLARLLELSRALAGACGPGLTVKTVSRHGNKLRPGGYGLVRAVMSVKKGALLIPQRAVTDMQGKMLVAVIGADNKASIRQVKVAERIGSDWIIDEGLKPGEKVVVEGTQKVKPDMVVNPQPFDPDKAAKAAQAKAQGAAAKPEGKPAAAPAEKR